MIRLFCRTKETLSCGNLLSVINVLMQLRKVCNHPNLFEPRPIISPFQMEGINYHTASLVSAALDYDPFRVSIFSFLFFFSMNELIYSNMVLLVHDFVSNFVMEGYLIFYEIR